MTQEFVILTVETDLINKKIIVTTNNKIDPNSINDIHVEIMERSSRTQLMYTLEIKENVLEVILTEWPLPNSSYVFYLKTLKNVLGEELRSGIRRKVEFDSSITKEVKITSPIMHQQVESIDISLEYIDYLKPEDKPVHPIEPPIEETEDIEDTVKTCTYIEISNDNGFYNVLGSTRIFNDEKNVTLVINKEGQLFIRARVESDPEAEKFEYSKWSPTISFVYGRPSCEAPEVEKDEDYIPDFDNMSPVIEDEEEFELELLTPYGVTTNELIFLANKPINEDLFNPNLIIVKSREGMLRVMASVVDRLLTIKILEPIKNNSIYDIKLLSIFSETGERINKDFKFATKLTPLYCEVRDVTALIGEFRISDEIILQHIHEGSKFADYLIETSLYPFEFDEDNVPFKVKQLVKYYAAHEALLRYIVDITSSTGLKGTVGNVTFEEKETTKDITNLLKHFCGELDKWKDALKGYENEGRARVQSAVKGRYASPDIQPFGLTEVKTFGRGDLYGK